MKIALFHNLPSGGAKRAVYEWTRHLTPRHRVGVYTLSTADQRFCDLRPHTDMHIEYECAPATLLRHPWGRLNQFQRWRHLGRVTRTHRALARAIDDEGYDVVFANPCAFTQIPILLQFIRTPTVYFLHEPIGRALQPDGRQREDARLTLRARFDRIDPLIRLYQQRLDRVQRRSLSSASRLLANSAFTRDRMKRAYGVDAFVCPCGVDSDAFRILPDVVKARHVLSVGELSVRKGFGFIVEALALIPAASRPALRLACNTVAPDERRRVEALADRHGVRVDVLQGLGTEELVREYNRAALLVYAPINEPFGLVALESMACGTPLVAVREGGVRESVLHRQSGVLVRREPAEFAQAVAFLLSKPELAREYGRNGRARVETHWTWKRSCDALEEQLSAVVGEVGAGHARAAERSPLAPGSPVDARREFVEHV